VLADGLLELRVGQLRRERPHAFGGSLVEFNK
jgi:hypothetical protein